MPPYDIIEGPKLHGLINQLVSDRTLIKLSIPRTAYERLTVITQVRPENAPLYFRIDPPEGAKAIIERQAVKTLDFEFTGQDHVVHRFDANLHLNSADNFWLHLPKQIQRIQQRENVRIEPGLNSSLELEIDDSHLDLPIKNMSIGGVLCTCPNKYKSLIEIGRQWKNVPMELVLAMDIHHVTVGRLQVLRVMPGSRPKHFNMALAFRQISKQDYQKLIQYINACQREMLKIRSRLK